MTKTEEQLRAIGSVTLEFGSLEWLLDNLLVGINCEFKVRDQSPTGYDSISKRVNLIAFRLEKKFPQRLAEWRILDKRITAVTAERYRLLQSAFEEMQPIADTCITREDRWEFAAEEGLALAAQVRELNQSLSEFLRSFFETAGEGS